MRIEIIWLNKTYSVSVCRKPSTKMTGSFEELPNDWEKVYLDYLKVIVCAKGSSFAADIDKVDFFLVREP